MIQPVGKVVHLLKSLSLAGAAASSKKAFTREKVELRALLVSYLLQRISVRVPFF